MRFLVDECAGPTIAHWLADQGHTVLSVYDDARGMDDDEIVRKAFDERWILITNDKDFGEKIYRERRPHRGIILMRLDDEGAASKIRTLQQLLASHSDRLADCFVVVSETRLRFARPHGPAR